MIQVSSYLKLPEVLYKRARPEPVSEPRLRVFNYELADELGLGVGKLNNSPDILVGNTIFAGTEPFAQAYAGHQFGHFSILGDGRAHVLGEISDNNGTLWDLQLKGSGRTLFSRRGDGRAALGPMLREYIFSEAMAGLGVPTTRSLAVLTTGESVYREQILPGAVLCRVASSFIRVGTFEYLQSKGDVSAIKELADYAIARHYPEVGVEEKVYLAFLKSVIERQAKLTAKWMSIGFIHGVMNTDNVAISGETIDYGPCAFLDRFEPMKTFSSIDRDGRYAFASQPPIALWNLTRFAETLLPLLSPTSERAVELAEEALNGFEELFDCEYARLIAGKLGMLKVLDGDRELFSSLFKWMAAEGADFTNTFVELRTALVDEVREPISEERKAWINDWRSRLLQEGRANSSVQCAMVDKNPRIIPRNHLVEEVIASAVMLDDYEPLEIFVDLLRHPFANESSLERRYLEAKPGHQDCYQTFCGT